MKKVATILANGFEEIEALTIVDVLRRAGIDCDLVGMEETVTGSHQITVEVDRLWNGDLSDQEGSKLGDPDEIPKNGVLHVLGSLLVTLLPPQIRPALASPRLLFSCIPYENWKYEGQRFELHPVLRFLMLHKQNHDRL